MNSKTLFGSISISLVLFLTWLLVVGSWREMRALQATVGEFQGIFDERTKIFNNAAAQQKTLQDILKGSNAKNFSEFIPTKKNMAELLSAAQAMAVNSGVQLISIQFGEADATEGTSTKLPYESITLTMEGTGSYSALRSYLSAIEAYIRVLNVTSLQIEPAEQDGGLSFKVEATTYYIQ